ncbi:hypothetical protein AB0M20_35040 [Actinoplanes sp. NPDC051633]|uniref:hypothetical protein n=1 Tax=Actinoplanes sp. NPDC051633 TaxID=3155670 RepID=UPI0034287BFD
MLDDIRDLEAATAAYRAAATGAGIVWPDHTGPSGVIGPPPPLVQRLFDAGRVADQLTWFQAQGWGDARVLPEGGIVLPWPQDPAETLDLLTFALGTPFPWRRQMPLFHFDVVVYTFVLDAGHEGEIWRYDVDADFVSSVRAADSLAGLLTEWTNGIERGAVRRRGRDNWLLVDEEDVDPFVFPLPIDDYALLRERQSDCGVDAVAAEAVDEAVEARLDELDAIRAAM